METVLGVCVIGGFFIVYFAYARWLEKGIQPRQFVTSVPADEVRHCFVDAVVRSGWKLVDDGNPMVCQSSLLTGMRQQLGLTVGASDEGTVVHVGPSRWVTKGGVPAKAHTLRRRLNAFEGRVRHLDPSILVTRSPLQGS